MASFDIVSKVDHQKLDNAINTARRELESRYDFKDSKTEVDFDKKALAIKVTTENELRIKAVEDVLITRMVKQGLDPQALDAGAPHYASGAMVRKEIKVKEGLDKETAKKVVAYIKTLKRKVEPAIMDQQVRVSGKQLDDLQAVMAALKTQDFKIPLQFENYR